MTDETTNQMTDRKSLESLTGQGFADFAKNKSTDQMTDQVADQTTMI